MLCPTQPASPGHIPLTSSFSSPHSGQWMHFLKLMNLKIIQDLNVLVSSTDSVSMGSTLGMPIVCH